MQDDGDSTIGDDRNEDAEWADHGDDRKEGAEWADHILERARARSTGQPLPEQDPPSAEPAPTEPADAAGEPSTEETPVEAVADMPPRRPVLPTVEDPSPGEASAQPAEPDEFEPFAEAYARPGAESRAAEAAVFGSPEPLPPHLAVESAPPDDDLKIPGRAAGTARGVLEWVGVVLGALVVALLVKQFLFAAYYIPSPSMEPTLTDGDRIIVNKLSYRLHEVNRGDVVVFSRPPNQPEGIKDLIKRVIGLAGETVTASEGRVLIDGGLLIEPYLAWPEGTADFGAVPWCDDGGAGSCRVPEGHVFVMGDNRPDSRDSRFLGPIPVDSIVGRAFVRYWPPGSLDRL